ncbi:MAG: hypothetical protein KF901_19280 [Myxococcales bacterium]|nr:hypothetical protein [Myxococcales bacterium]
MGMLCDALVAPKDAAERIGKADAPADQFDGVDLKGLTADHFFALRAATLGDESEWDVAYQGGEDGPWVFAVPDDLLTYLSALESSELAAAARSWHQWDGGTFDFHTTEDLEEILDRLIPMARAANERGHGLFLWMSL